MSKGRNEGGEAVTETVIIVPTLLLLIMVVIQFGLWYHAQHVVQAAAQEGARAARAEGATADDGLERAMTFVAQVGGQSVHEPEVTSQRSSDGVTVRVTGEAPAVVPGLRLGVSAAAVSPVEEFTAP
ncbi:MAG: TadE family protein [Acidimicrobiia bacterium]